MKHKPKPSLPKLLDRSKYRQSSVILRMVGWLKENRRIITRFDNLQQALRRWSHSPVLCGVYANTFRPKSGLNWPTCPFHVFASDPVGAIQHVVNLIALPHCTWLYPPGGRVL